MNPCLPAPPVPRTERGMSESIQWAVLLPVLLLGVLGIIQAGIVLHARTAAHHAALAGAEAQSLSGQGSGVAERVARDVASQAGLLDVQVRVGGAGQVAVDVEARVDSFFPIGPRTVHAHAEMPREEP